MSMHHGEEGYFGSESPKKVKGGPHGNHHHTGDAQGKGVMHLRSKKGDGMAHESHHAHNKAHGTPQGFAPGEDYQNGGADHHLGCNSEEE